MYLAMHDALNAHRAEVSTVRVLRHRPVRRSDCRRGAGCPRRHEPHLSHASGKTMPSSPSGSVKSRTAGARRDGIRLGMASAAAIIAARANDNMLVVRRIRAAGPARTGRLPIRSAPGVRLSAGVRRFDPLRHSLGRRLPARATARAQQPGLRQIGQRDEGARPSAQPVAQRGSDATSRAWWLEFNETQWGRIMRQLTQKQGLALLEAVRMFALVNMANIDATVAVWHAKNFYDFWRPSHAIQLGDTDGNPTHARPTRAGSVSTPCRRSRSIRQPMRSSARRLHGPCERSSAPTMSAFATRSTTALPSNPVRSFHRLSVASRECGQSRIMAGFHYRFSVATGARMGGMNRQENRRNVSCCHEGRVSCRRDVHEPGALQCGRMLAFWT